MQVWRILRRRYLRDALSGRGGLVVSGRWHSRGRLIVYTSGSLALAALEVLVHSESDLAPPDLMSVAIDIPDDVPVSRMNSRRLPQRWRRHPAPASLQRLGDRWLAAQRTAVMQVPSAVIPSEHNYLINPTHPASRRVRIISVSRFSFDARLIQ